MDTIHFSLFLSFNRSSWEETSLLVFSFDVVSHIVFNILGTTQFSMASKEGFPKESPSHTHDSAVVTHPTLCQCTSRQDPCLHLMFMTEYPTDINTSVISLLIPPLHNYLTKLEISGTNKQKSCKLFRLLAWLGGYHLVPLIVPPCRNFLNPQGRKFSLPHTLLILEQQTVQENTLLPLPQF